MQKPCLSCVAEVLARDAQAKLALIVAQIYVCLSICPSIHLCVHLRVCPRQLDAALRVASHVDYRLVCLCVRHSLRFHQNDAS